MNGQLERLREASFDPENSVIVSALPSFSESAGLTSSRKVEVTASGLNEVTVYAEVPVPSVLVLSQTYYPGWKAFINGKQADVFDANLLLTGVGIGPGAHEVRFVFDPLSFKIGALLTVVSAIIIMALAYERTGRSKSKGTLGQPD
jgi:uncharacterized membrane protein YfhO